jgi:hypothetical protein
LNQTRQTLPSRGFLGVLFGRPLMYCTYEYTAPDFLYPLPFLLYPLTKTTSVIRLEWVKNWALSVLQYCLHNKRNYPTYFLKISFCRIIQFIVSMKYEEQKNAPRTMFKPTYFKYILAALNARCSLSEKLTQNVHMYLFWVSLTDFLHRLQLSYVNRKWNHLETVQFLSLVAVNDTSSAC